MYVLKTRLLALALGFAHATFAANILIADAKSQPVKGPDGMRAANGKIFVAENGSGKISVITVHGEKASITVIKEGLQTLSGVEPAGDTLWIAERGADKAVSIPMPR
jgi:hypothetical protein